MSSAKCLFYPVKSCSDADATVLACVAFSCPNLEAFEMKIGSNAVNRITGYVANFSATQ